MESGHTAVQRGARGSTGAIPPTGLVIIAITSVQLGATIAKHLFSTVGPGGAVLLRVGFAAIVLLAIWRTRVRGHARSAYISALLFGLALAAMNYSFYQALDRIPLGVAVTLEFVGPLGVAIAGSRRLLDLVWVLFAATGIILLNPWNGAHLDPAGVLFALLAGSCWAAYIYLSARVGRDFPRGEGLALAMVVGTLLLLPIGLAAGGTGLLDPRLLVLGASVALLSSLIPYSLEMEALRHIPPRVFGVLMSLEPALATLFGFIILHQVLNGQAIAAVLLVTVAAAGASQSRREAS